MHMLRSLVVAVVATCCAMTVSAFPPPPVYSTEWAFPDANGSIFCSHIYNGHLYLGGNFTMIGGIPAACVVEWDGEQFHALGAGLSSSNVSTLAARAMTVFDGKLIVAGNYTTAGGADAGSIAAWDSVTRTWTVLGQGLAQTGGAPADVRTLEVASLNGGPSTLFAGGFFNLAGGQACLNVAGYTGGTWNSAGGGYNGTINSLEFWSNRLYAGGTGSSANRFRFWDGANAWTTVPNAAISGGSTRINDLEGIGSALFIGGNFTSIGASTASPNVASFDGTVCSPLGTGLPGAVNSFASHNFGQGTRLTAAFTSATDPVRVYDPVSAMWTPVAPAYNGTPNTLCSDQSGNSTSLFAGGTTFLVNFPGFAWTSPGGGINGQFASVTALEVGRGPDSEPGIPPGNLYVAGAFTSLVHAAVNVGSVYEAQKIVRVASARNAAVTSLNREVTRFKRACAAGLSGGDPFGLKYIHEQEFLAVCGGQTSAGGQPSGGLSFFRPLENTWSNPTVPAHFGTIETYLHIDGTSDGYYGGSFEGTTDPTTRYWNRVTQVPFPCGRPNAGVRTSRVRAPNSREVIRAGFFSATGCDSQPTGFMDTFNLDTQQSTPWPGDLLNGPVHATCDTRQESAIPGLYVGGAFTAAGPTTLNHVAYWNGAAWEALGSGVDSNVAALCMWDDGEGENLYVVGSFLNAGGQPANRIARWDGSAWSPVLGDTGVNGLNGAASSMVVIDFGDGHGPTLVIGGSFTTAGGLSSGRLAQLVARGLPVIARQPPAVVQVEPGTEAVISLRAHRSPPLTYQWRHNSEPISDGGRISGANSPTLRIANTQPGDEGQYDCLVTNAFGDVGSSLTDFLFNLIPCPADFNRDGNIDPDDLSDYIACFFSPVPCPAADINFDGNIDPDDLSDYIALFFAPRGPPC